jgi:ABC-type glycerol-3-phosphate transport system substrate-binding protein
MAKSMRILAFIVFAAVAAVVLLFSCSKETKPNEAKNGETPEEGESPAPENEQYSMLEERLKVADNIEDEDMGGMAFRVTYRDNHYIKELFVEEETGENVEDAIYLRNKKIEERFNINFVTVPVTSPEKEALKAVRAGDDALDLVVTHMIELAGSSLSNPYLDWGAMPTVDLSQIWFLQDAVKEMSVNNKLFVVPGEYCLSILYNSYCMYFNKTLVQNYGLENPYRLVLEGKWTLETLNEVTRGMYQDLDGDGKKSTGDFYGLATNYYSAVVTYTYSSGMRIMQNNAAGIPENVVPNEKAYANFNKIYDLLINNPGAFAGNWGEDGTIYRENRAVFLNDLFSAAKGFRTLEDDFGMIPYPKFDEAQQRYYTMSDGGSSMMAIPNTIKDPGRVGKIVSALNAESWKTVVPQYYDVALKIKFARDDESVQVLDMLLDGRTFDFGYIYDNWQGYAFFMQDLISAKSDGISSWFDKRAGSADKNLEKVLQSFED